MARLFDVLKRLLSQSSQRPSGTDQRRRDPQFVGRSSSKEIEEAPPERVGELVGHATERVET
jgi:hypothetical protein